MGTLLDRIRSGAIGLFAGPDLPGGDPHAGDREGLISAGLATIMASNQGATPLEALAAGAVQGREAGKQARQEFESRQARQQVEQFLQANGYDRQSLTSVAFRLLSSGDLDGAKSVFALLQSLPTPDQNNLNVSFQTIGDRRMQVVTDRLTGDIISQTDIGPAAQDAFFERVEEMQINGEPKLVGIERGTGRQVIIGDPVPDDGSGGIPAQSRVMSGVGRELVDQAFNDPGLRSLAAGSLANIAASNSMFSGAANLALGAVAADTQAANNARGQLSAVITPMISGAQMTDTEREYYKAAFLPRVGDTDENNEKKRAATILLLDRFSGRDITQVPTAEIRAEFADIAAQAGIDPAPAPDFGENPFADLIPRN